MVQSTHSRFRNLKLANTCSDITVMAFEDKSLRGGNSGVDIYNEIVLHHNKYNNVSYFKKRDRKKNVAVERGCVSLTAS